MTTYLILFPSGAMTFPPGELPAVADASRAVVRAAKDAGVWVFGGGIDEGVPPVLVDGDGTVTEGTYPETARIEGGYAVLELPSREAALEWAARIAAACRCAQEVRAFQPDPELNRHEGVLAAAPTSSREQEVPMELKLELVVLPVADVDRAKAFYVDVLGFAADVDVRPAPGTRVVQVTPPGSACSLGFGSGLESYGGEPGSVQHLHLVVEDIDATRAELLARGVDVAPVLDVGGGVRYAAFSDPDGNGFVLQEMAWRRGDAF